MTHQRFFRHIVLCLVLSLFSVLSARAFTLQSGRAYAFSMPAEWRYASESVATLMHQRTGVTLKESHADTATIRIVHDAKLSGESYSMQIGGDSIVLRAASIKGVNWGMSQLSQLVAAAPDKQLSECMISDSPRFEHRGLMIDCSRHFRTIAELQSLIDAMNLLRLNILHLHLTDNQGWRLALERFPEVARRGTHYPDFPELSDKYYTPDELKSLVAYAYARGIEIIPEVDMPGHCLALLASMPELSCRGGEFEPFPEERLQNDRKRAWENMLCVSNPRVYDIVEAVVAQLADIFPSRYIHLGGDEVSTVRWKECKRCQALYHSEHMTDLHQLQDYFTRRAGEIVRRYGKRLMGWDEINDRCAADASDVVCIWQRDAAERSAKALGRGMQVVMCPKDPCYFDFGYARNSTKKVFEWQPLKGIPAEQQSQVRGAQACLWTEFVRTKADVDHMLYPRLCALAEVLWTGGGGSYDEFVSRLDKVVLPLLARTGNAAYAERLDATIIFRAESSHAKLLAGATIDTNMPGVKFYEKEYAYDGDESTFFCTPYSDLEGEHFTVTLDNAVSTRRVAVAFDDSKEYPHGAVLEASADGKELFAGILHAKESKHFEAKDKLIIKYGNIGVVRIKVNGEAVDLKGEHGVAVKTYLRNAPAQPAAAAKAEEAAPQSEPETKAAPAAAVEEAAPQPAAAAPAPKAEEPKPQAEVKPAEPQQPQAAGEAKADKKK